MHIKGVILALVVLAPTILAALPVRALAADGTLYEVSEAINVSASGKVKGFKSSEATLSGTVKSGTPLCPSWVTTQLGTDSCWIIVHALGGADELSGTGPVAGKMFVLAELKNSADAPELKILSADFDGELDLSAAFFQQIPRGTIAGKYTAKGEPGSIMDGYKVKGTFEGVFRLPFMYGPQASYLQDDGNIVPLTFGEYSVGQPTPRLELTFPNTGSATR